MFKFYFQFNIFQEATVLENKKKFRIFFFNYTIYTQFDSSKNMNHLLLSSVCFGSKKKVKLRRIKKKYEFIK